MIYSNKLKSKTINLFSYYEKFSEFEMIIKTSQVIEYNDLMRVNFIICK